MQTKTKKPGLPASVEKYVGQVWGTPAPGHQIPIDTPMHPCQREYKKQNVYKYIAKVQGLDWNLFGYATAIKRKSDGKLAIIDAQHRIQLVKIVSPTTQLIPAHIIEVEDSEFESGGARYFSGPNGGLNKNLTNEEMFWASVMAKDPDSLKMEALLIKCGLSCGRVNQLPTTLPVVYANFKKCMKLGEAPTVRAVALLKKGFKSVADDPLHGLVYLLSRPEYSVLGDPNVKIGKDFEEWLTKAVPMFHNLNDLKFKKYRANPAWYKGIAYALVKNFAKFQRSHSRTAPPAIASIKKDYESGFKKDGADELLD